jgi:cobalt-zinc-cadmium efflux system protein
MASAHQHHHDPTSRDADRRSLRNALALIALFMVAEVVAGLIASSLALVSDAAHMLTDVAALAVALVATRLATRPAGGSLTYGLGRAEILSAQFNGATLLVLAALIIYGAINRLISPPHPAGLVMIVVATVGVAVNLRAAKILAGPGRRRNLNVEGSYRHVLNDLYGFVATAIAGVAILAAGWRRADAIASLLIAALMLYAAYGLLKSSWRVFLEAAPAGLDPDQIGRALAEQPGVVEVHDLHVWEVTSDFPALSAHVIAGAGDDCHAIRRALERLLDERFGVRHTTLQVDHQTAAQGPLQIETAPPVATVKH